MIWPVARMRALAVFGKQVMSSAWFPPMVMKRRFC
jgi:hypothetical protein